MSSVQSMVMSRAEEFVTRNTALGCSVLTIALVVSIRKGTIPSPETGTEGKLGISGAALSSVISSFDSVGLNSISKGCVSFSASEKTPSPTTNHGAGSRRVPEMGAPKLLQRRRVLRAVEPIATLPKSTFPGITERDPGGFLIRIVAVRVIIA